MARDTYRVNRTFPGWLSAIGEEAASALIGVKIRTIRSWWRGERTPSPAMARKIVSATRGAVTMDMIYRGGGKP